MFGYSSKRFDFEETAEVKKLLLVASSYRSGSTFVSTTLWKDGRFGAPFEYFNFEKHMMLMMARLGTEDVDEYINRLTRLRTSRNGLFSAKAHFHHFESITSKAPLWKSRLEGSRFIYVNRIDKIRQAVSMAIALQTNAWTSFEQGRSSPTFYSKDFIEECLNEVMRQCQSWWGWFNRNGIQPFTVNYEDFAADPDGKVAKLSKWLEVESDRKSDIDLPVVERQATSQNEEWVGRFLSERKRNGKQRTGSLHPQP